MQGTVTEVVIVIVVYWVIEAVTGPAGVEETAGVLSALHFVHMVDVVVR